MKEVTLPEGLTSIEFDAFGYCKSLAEVTLPKGLISIGGGAFRECDSLRKITLPDSMTSMEGGVEIIGKSAFKNCQNLQVVFQGTGFTTRSVPNGITKIEDYMFHGCEKLTSATLPRTVKEIGNYAFYECSALKKVYMYKSVTSIAYTSFGHAYAGENEKGSKNYDVFSIVWLDGNSSSSTTKTTTSTSKLAVGTVIKDKASGGTYKVTKAGKEVVYQKPMSTGKKTVTIPATIKSNGTTRKVTSIAAKAFSGNSKITSVTIGKNVVSIGSSAFKNCKKLNKVSFGAKLKTIGNEAFYGCKALKSVGTDALKQIKYGYSFGLLSEKSSNFHLPFIKVFCKI